AAYGEDGEYSEDGENGKDREYGEDGEYEKTGWTDGVDEDVGDHANEDEEVGGEVGLNVEQEVGGELGPNEEQEVWSSSSPASSSSPERCLKRKQLDGSDGGANGRNKRVLYWRTFQSGEIGAHFLRATLETGDVGTTEVMTYVDTSFTCIIEQPSKESIERYWKRIADEFAKKLGGQQYDYPWKNIRCNKALPATYAILRVYQGKKSVSEIARVAEELGLKCSMNTINTALSRIFKVATESTGMSNGKLFEQSEVKRGGTKINVYCLKEDGDGNGANGNGGIGGIGAGGNGGIGAGGIRANQGGTAKTAMFAAEAAAEVL
ncbi:hypothetical protein HK102_007870, partial [Quaeritorhiza haematococci]